MAHNAEYQLILQRLRTVRKVKGWTLKKVEEYSHGDILAVVLGSWERGNRKPSLERLIILCTEIYHVPFSALLLDDEGFRNALAHEIMRSDKFAKTFSPAIYRGGK